MPGPPPPPPPAGPPPPPTFMPPPPMKGGSDDRGALLNSIRKGAKLKKTVTVDKSAPMISAKVSNITSSSSSNTSVSERVPSSASPMTNGLGALFPDGIPKLKPTGRNLGGSINHIGSNNNNSQSNNQRTPDAPLQHQKSFAITQKELKKQMASDSRNRGPPPPAPIRNISNTDDFSKPKRPQMAVRNGGSNAIRHNSSIHSISLESNSSSLHKKATSDTNLRSYDRSDSTDSSHNNLPSKLNFGKPNLAPKPPTLNGKPKKLSINGKPVSRTQSMKTPRSPSPQSPECVNANFSKFGTMKNFPPGLTESLSSIYQQKTRPAISERPKAPPPSVPHHHSPSTPPPPSKMNMVKHPGHAPPPPPVVQPPIHAPPLPPHRTAPQVPSRAPPAIPVNSNGNAPPPPPRNSSIKDAAAGRRTSSPTDFEVKFANHFHDVNEFPRPDVFRGFPKNYSSKQVGNKQQAPLPPNHIQLNSRLWDSSAC